MSNILDILKYIGPLLGVFIGSLLTRESQKKKIRYEELRQIKRCLYVFLEIRNQITLNKKIDKYIHILTDQINSQIETNESEQLNPDSLNELVKKLIPSLLGDNFHNDLKDQFRKCVDNLSEIDPLLAYRINGKQNIQDYIDTWEKKSSAYLGINNVKDVKRAVELFKPKLLEEIKTDIEKIIKDVSSLLGKKEQEKIGGILTDPKDEDIRKNTEKYLTRLFAD